MKKSPINLRETEGDKPLDIYSKQPATLQETPLLEEKLLHISQSNFMWVVISLTK